MVPMFTLDETRAALGPELLMVRPGAAATAGGFSGVANDSRTAMAGQLFVALQTEVRDGHSFVGDAVARGAAGVLVSRDVDVAAGVTVLRVRDTRHALGELARAWRARFPEVKVIVITGNVGKTSTKELTAALLGRYFNVLKSPANFNDEVGLSMTIFQLTEAHDRAVLEVGMDHLGEIRRSCEIARPESAVVLNVGPTHLERLGSLEAIADAKAEAVEALSESGTAFLNADDPFVSRMGSRTRARVVTFGIEHEADFRATGVVSRGLDGVNFMLQTSGQLIPTHSPLPGARLVANALAAVAVLVNEGISPADAARALAEVEVPARLRARRGPDDTLILDDSYNASPPSMLAALGVLAETPGRRIALLGDMLELGSAEAEGHRIVGERAAQVANVLFTTGARGRLIAEAAAAAGMKGVQHFDSKDDVLEALRAILGRGDVLLVKASHGIALHTVVEALAEAEEPSHA